jgi:hypothetical protein
MSNRTPHTHARALAEWTYNRIFSASLGTFMHTETYHVVEASK